jgi:hypothetical protein
VLNFLHDHIEAGVFDPDAVNLLVAAFDDAWQSIKDSGPSLSDKQIELTRVTLAKYIIEQARHGERDQRRLRDRALLQVRPPPRSNDTRQRSVSPEVAVICFGSTCSFVPQAAIGRSFDHLVGARGPYRRNVEAERCHMRFVISSYSIGVVCPL